MCIHNSNKYFHEPVANGHYEGTIKKTVEKQHIFKIPK